MVFVNRIASVIHSCVNEFFGNPNKNIGPVTHFECRFELFRLVSDKAKPSC